MSTRHAHPHQNLRIELPVLLPQVPDAHDRCVHQLTEDLVGRPGVTGVHLEEGEAGPAHVCIHYDPESLSVARLRHLAEAAGAHITERIGHVVWEVTGLHNQRLARTVVEHLREQPGVLEAEANAAGPLRIELDRELTSEQTLLDLLAELDVHPIADADVLHPHDHDHHHDHGAHGWSVGSCKGCHGHDHGLVHRLLGERAELIFALVSGALVGVGWAVGALAAVSAWVPTALFAAAYAFGGWFTLREALGALRVRRFEIDALMIVAALGAAAMGNVFEGGLLLFLFSLGHALEHYAMGRARKAIEALGELAPETARVRRGGVDETVPIEALHVGDRVIVHPHERIPADGFVLAGASAVDQAAVTGESVPVDKKPVTDLEAARQAADDLEAEHRVFAGTLNGASTLEVEVTRLASESTLARVVRLVAEAETERSPTQRFADRFERIFVPVVLVSVVLLLFAWVVVDEPFSASFYRAMAVLVAASPCALAIATPSAVLAGVARAGRAGVLIKGGGPLEALGDVEAIAFDKTGTLTEGEPRVTDVVAAEGATRDELVRVAVAVESRSQHPLARAVVRDLAPGLGEASTRAEDLESLTGRGVRARVDGDEVHIGNLALFDEQPGAAVPDALRAAVEALSSRGRSTMVVRKGARYLGALGLMDTPRAAAAPVLAGLHALGIERTIMISGDDQSVADAVAREIGLDEARGNLMPEDKVAAIRQLREATGGRVAMVGDGVNDAPAMAHATVGVAMGAAGSDVALETADIALMADDLHKLPFAVGLSRKTRRIIRQNLWISLGMVAVLVPATLTGLGIGPAVVLHEGSTLVVVLNALRLLGHREHRKRKTRPFQRRGRVMQKLKTENSKLKTNPATPWGS